MQANHVHGIVPPTEIHAIGVLVEEAGLPDELLSVTQAAKELDMHPDSVRRAILQDRLKATKIGPRAWVIRRRDLERYRETPKQPGGRPRAPRGGAPDGND
jgi:excisionase family DNA binding protein